MRQQLVEFRTGKRAMLRGALKLHEAIRLKKNDIRVDPRIAVLQIGEVEPWFRLDNAHRHGGDQRAKGTLNPLAGSEPAAGVG
jgi:hypothetical protein